VAADAPAAPPVDRCPVCKLERARHDEPCCPACLHYNALLATWRGETRIRRCRDCGFETEAI